MSTVVVTGASGHIGANLVQSLLDQGRRVRAVAHTRKGLLEGAEVEWVEADVRDKASLVRAFEGADVVYHLVALISIDGEQGGLVPEINVKGAANAAQAALECGVRRLIHFSSVHAFDIARQGGAVDESWPRSNTPQHNAYDRSKAAGEVEVRKVIEAGLDAVIVHPTGVIGPNDGEPSRMGQVFLDLYHRKLPGLINGGFNWVDVRDVVAGAMAAEVRGQRGRNYLLSGHWRSVAELASLAESITGVKPPWMVSPMWLARVGAPFQVAFNRMLGQRPLYTSESLEALRANRDISHARASAELGYAPRPIERSVEDIYSWFRARGMLAGQGEG